MKFADIPFHEAAKGRLRDMIDNERIPHALIIEGPAGVGKFALARAAAQYIHCTNRTADGDSCGECPSCRQHQSFNHIDTNFVFPIVKKRKSGSDAVCDDWLPEWRDYLRENPFMDFQEWLKALGSPTTQPQIYVSEAAVIMQRLSYTAHSSRYKIVLLWLAERLNVDTSNKLLKLIEEPHPDTLFVLTTNNPSQILPTIYSRTQRIELKRLPDSEVASALMASNPSLDDETAMQAARLGEGSLVEATNALALSAESRRYLDLFISVMRLAYQRNVGELKEWAATVASLGREPAMRFLQYCQRLVRENFIYNLQIAQLNRLNDDEAAFSRNFARFINERNVIAISSEIDKAIIDIAGNANGKIVMFDFAVRMIMLLKQ